MNNALRIGGLQAMTSIDFPGQLSAVVFLQGCPWRCRYCQNAHLIPPRSESLLAEDEMWAFLERRRGLLDGVVFSGGEPTLQAGLEAALRRVREMGFKTALHTAGAYPERLKRLLPLLDWVGLDIKASAADYPALTGVPDSGERAWRSLARLIAFGGNYEVRTTVHPALLNERALDDLQEELTTRGVQHRVVQDCVRERCLDPLLRH